MGCPLCVVNVPDLSSDDLDRLIGMAWEDRTPFEAIEVQFGLKENEVRALMRRHLKPGSFRRWRARELFRVGANWERKTLRPHRVPRFPAWFTRFPGCHA